MANRTGKGCFQKGRSGNPSGRPKVVTEVRDLAREHTNRAIRTLVSVMEDEDKPAAARVSAANHILDRGYGKPQQEMDHEPQEMDTLSALMRGIGQHSLPLLGHSEPQVPTTSGQGQGVENGSHQRTHTRSAAEAS